MHAAPQNCRAILINEENRHYLRWLELMENRNYTVELRRASKGVPELPSIFGPPKKLYFNQDGIKRGRVAHVGEFFRREHVNVPISGCKFCPIQLRGNYAAGNLAVNLGLELDFAPRVEHSDGITVSNAARARVD